MSARRKTTIGVVFGGRSVEHDVSIITANQIMRAFDTARYDVVPIYINRDGRWYTGEPLLKVENFKDEIISMKGVTDVILSPAMNHHGLIINPVSGRLSKSEIMRLDVVFPALHGSHGEDGTIQGLLELADIPYTGCMVLGSALANDKILTKTVLRQHDLPVLDDVHFSRADWLRDSDTIMQQVQDSFGFPVFVKPATTGSSIGVTRADSADQLRASIDIAAHFDRRVLVEPAVTGGVEINCAVLGNAENIRPSVLEQPISWQDFLTYEDKYMRGSEGMKSAERVIPAPIDAALTERIQQAAVAGFKAIDGMGTARIDFLVYPDRGEFYLNEINTLPGSLAFYLWEATGLSMTELVHEMVELAREAHAEKRRTSYDYQSDLIALTAARGLKGTKGSKNPQKNLNSQT